MDIMQNWQESKNVLMEGLTPSQRKVVGPLLENQKKYLTEEAAAGSTSAHDIAGFRKVLIPMIRRIIPGTIASELVGVQPMSGPVDQVFSLRYKYNDAVARAGDPNGNIAAGDELFGNDTPIGRFYSGGTNVAQGAGAGGFGPGATTIDVSDAGDAGTEVDYNPYPGITGTPSGAGWGSSLDISDSTGHRSYGGSGSFIEGSGGRSISLEVVSQAVEANSRKLQSSWTLEAMQDANRQHGLDIESEMTQAMSAEIVQEIDAEILGDLMGLAGTVGTFSGSLAGAPANYTPTFVGDRFANLGAQINRVANEIARKTRRGAGNYVVVSPMIVSLLQTASKSVFAPAISGSFKGPNNTMLVGTLNGTIKVYSYLWNQTTATESSGTGDDTILIGYKGGDSETDTGYFYCPYVPLVSTGTIINPYTMQPVVGMMTRYGKSTFTSATTSLGNSADYYGKVSVVDLTFA